MSYRDCRRRELVPAEPIPPSRMKATLENRPLTRKQHQFVEECLNSARTFSDVLKDLQLDGARLGLWLRQASFRKELLRIRMALGRQREMELAMGARRGAEFLNRTFAQPNESDRNVTARCRAAATLVNLARTAEAMIKKENTIPWPPQRDLSHPDNPHAETIRLLNELERKEEAD